MGKVTEVNVVTGKQTTRDMTDSEKKDISSPAPSESAQLDALRYERNMLLKETDWMSLPDAPTMSDAWKKYRQDLRDITKTYKSLDDVKWPTEPTS
tara:strand:+ start:185 stop:472 length:288 start_codon:yes stop_codon:yes gene_type:complete